MSVLMPIKSTGETMLHCVFALDYLGDVCVREHRSEVVQVVGSLVEG